MARHVMTPARKAALRKAQLASARKRRKGIGSRAKSIASAQRTYQKRKRRATYKHNKAAVKNELRFYKGTAVAAASKLTGAKPKSRKLQAASRPGRGKRFWAGHKRNYGAYQKSMSYAKRVRKNKVKKALKRRKRR